MHAIAARRLALIPSALLVTAGLTVAPGVTPSAAAADPVYTICNADASNGYYDTSAGANYMSRIDSFPNGYPELKIWESQCKQATINSTSNIVMHG